MRWNGTGEVGEGDAGWQGPELDRFMTNNNLPCFSPASGMHDINTALHRVLYCFLKKIKF